MSDSETFSLANKSFTNIIISLSSMSLGGPASTSEDEIVRAAINRGVNFAVAAGNDAVDACSETPARVYEA